MTKDLKFILIINILVLSLNAGDTKELDCKNLKDKREEVDCKIKKIEKKISCLNRISLDDKIECLKKRMEEEINADYNDGVQLSVFSEAHEKEAKDEVEKYNKWKNTIDSLKKTNAEYILKEFKGHKTLKDGKYYVVFVVQKGKSVDKLRKKIQKNYPKSYSSATIFKSPKVVIEYPK